MSRKELDRYQILERVNSKELTQKDAARMLDLSDRQIRNILRSMKENGVQGIVSKKRGKPSNRQIDCRLKEEVIHIIHEQQYADFGPTLLKEKLLEFHDIALSAETIRQWMIQSGFWTPRIKKRKTHLLRQRRPCFGELIQADGSSDHWFGEDHPKANLTVFIDDATSTLTSLHFSKTETLEGYFQGLKKHLQSYGRPLALYTDHYAVFEAHNKTGETQMQRALKDLNVELILANSAQAKGRVERANRTLQDRLIKELRLRKITTIEEANNFLPEFIEDYNKKFSKKPMKDLDTHRSLEGYDLERILSRHESRTLQPGRIFQYKTTFYQVQDLKNIPRMEGRKVEVSVNFEGLMKVFLGDFELKFEEFHGGSSWPIELDRKEVSNWEPKVSHPVKKDHPWKKYGYQIPREKKIREGMKKDNL